MRHSAGDGARGQFPDGVGVLIALQRQVLPDKLVRHEVQADLCYLVSKALPRRAETPFRDISTYVWRNARHRRDNAPIQRLDASLRPVHGAHGLPHAGELGRLGAELRERRRLDREARAHDVERVREGDGGDAGDPAAEQARYRREAVPGVALEKLLRPESQLSRYPNMYPYPARRPCSARKGRLLPTLL